MASDQAFRLPPTHLCILFDAVSAFPAIPSSSTTKDWSNTTAVSNALKLLPKSEQEKSLRFYKPKDAALSLGSSLLKHYAISHLLQIPWTSTPITAAREVSNGKPFYEPGGCVFNVSHHGDVVVLLASTVPGVNVGVDVVKVDVEKDSEAVKREGSFNKWLKMFEEVLSEKEMWRIAHYDEGVVEKKEKLRRQLRAFYAHWALKEAYIKYTSDALMADWLKLLEFTKVIIPESVSSVDSALSEVGADNRLWKLGEVTRVETCLRGQNVDSVRMEIQALGDDYMVATAISVVDGDKPPPFEEVKMDEILRIAIEWTV